MYFASGESFYFGAALLLILAVISNFSLPAWRVLIWRASTWVALAMMIMASPPFPWILDVIFGAIFLTWLISAHSKRPAERAPRMRTGSTCALIVLLMGLTVGELRHRRLPVIRTTPYDHVVVLGDSISAGLGGRVRPWPDLMQQMSGIQVKNLSKAGATIKDGLGMASEVISQDHLVLIELGGNDLIAGGSADSFSRSLESVLKRLAEPGRTVIMFELPLLPEMIPYGQAQRLIAKKYGVVLIPKRFFAGVLSGTDATSDGLHLTEVGAHRMALLMARMLAFSAHAS